jgi:hypothetical protein
MPIPLAEPPKQWSDELVLARKVALTLFLGEVSNHQARVRERDPERFPNWPTPQPLPTGRPGYSVADLRRYYAAVQRGEA